MQNFHTRAPTAADHRPGYCGTGCQSTGGGRRSNRAAIHSFHRLIHSRASRPITTPHYARDRRAPAVEDTPTARAGPWTGAATEELIVEDPVEGRTARESQRDTPPAPPAPNPDPFPTPQVCHPAAFLKQCGNASYARGLGCETFHGARRGLVVDHPDQDAMMASRSFESHPASRISPWSASTCNRSYLIAALRAGAIALVLLGILALIILF